MLMLSSIFLLLSNAINSEGMFDETDVSGDEEMVDQSTSPSPESYYSTTGQERAIKSPADSVEPTDSDDRKASVDTFGSGTVYPNDGTDRAGTIAKASKKDREGLSDNGEGPSSKKPFKQDSSDIEKTDFMDHFEDNE